jgi:hypothetical protein
VATPVSGHAVISLKSRCLKCGHHPSKILDDHDKGQFLLVLKAGSASLRGDRAQLANYRVGSRTLYVQAGLSSGALSWACYGPRTLLFVLSSPVLKKPNEEFHGVYMHTFRLSTAEERALMCSISPLVSEFMNRTARQGRGWGTWSMMSVRKSRVS